MTSQVRSSGQGVSDLIFTLSNDAGILGTTSASGQLGNVSGNPTPGVVTYVAGSPTRWIGAGHLSVSGADVTFEVLGGGPPDQLILPFIANAGQYTDANNGVHKKSYVIGPATFELDLAGVTAATTVTAATFSFGTNPELPACRAPARRAAHAVPEPASLALLGTALAGLGSCVAASGRNQAAALDARSARAKYREACRIDRGICRDFLHPTGCPIVRKRQARRGYRPLGHAKFNLC